MKIGEAVEKMKSVAKDSFSIELEIWNHSDLEQAEQLAPMWKLYDAKSGRFFKSENLEKAVEKFCEEVSKPEPLFAAVDEQLSDLPQPSPAPETTDMPQPEPAIAAPVESAPEPAAAVMPETT